MSDAVSVALRAISFALLLQAAGMAYFVAVFGGYLEVSGDVIRRMGQISAVLGAAVVAGHYVLEAARMAGDLSGVTDLSLQRIVMKSSSGAAFGMRMVGLLIIATAMRQRGELAVSAGIVGATLSVAAFTFTGHTSVHPERWILDPLLALHLVIVAFWFGGLLALNVASAREDIATTARLLSKFSAVATWLVPGILLAGGAMTLLLVPNLTVFSQPYGLLLIVKFLGFLGLMGLAAVNKWRLAPAITRGSAGAVTWFRRSTVIEYAAIVAVLSVTAVMTSFFSPD